MDKYRTFNERNSMIPVSSNKYSNYGGRRGDIERRDSLERGERQSNDLRERNYIDTSSLSYYERSGDGAYSSEEEWRYVDDNSYQNNPLKRKIVDSYHPQSDSYYPASDRYQPREEWDQRTDLKRPAYEVARPIPQAVKQSLETTLSEWRHNKYLPSLRELGDLFHNDCKNVRLEVSDDLLDWLGESFPHVVNCSPLQEEQNWSLNIGKIVRGCQQIECKDNALYRVGINNFFCAVSEYLEHQSRAKHYLNAASIACALYGLHHFSLSKGVEKLLLALSRHINGCCEKFTGKELGMALYGLKSLNTSDGTEAVLTALIGYIERCIGGFNLEGMVLALAGLQGKHATPGVVAMVKGLSEQVAKGLDQKSEENAIFNVANILDIVNTHFLSGDRELKAHALCLVFSVLKQFDSTHWSDDQTYKILSLEYSLDEIIFGLMKDSGAISINSNHFTMKCDLHHCSHSLAKRLVMECLLRFKNGLDESTTIIFGRSRHKIANKDRMKNVVIDVLNDYNLEGFWQKWEEGCFVLGGVR